MRNVFPLGAVQRVDFHHSLGLAVVAPQQLAVGVREAFSRQRRALLQFLVHLKLEFGEHHLAEERLSDRLQPLAQVVQLFLARLRVLDHVVVEQHLVADRGRFGDERRVLRLLVRLIRIGQHRVNRVSPLVGQRRERLVIVVVVQQKVRVHPVGAPVHVGPGMFALVRQRAHPATREPAAQQAQVFVPHRSQRGQRGALRLGDAEAGHRGGRKQRRIVVVVGELVADSQQPLAQAQIAVQGRKCRIGLGHQGSVDLGRHVVGEQRRLQRAVEAARLGREDVAHILGCQVRSHRSLVALPRAPERVEHGFAVGS